MCVSIDEFESYRGTELERDGRNGNANAACHRATGRLVASDSWYRSDQPSRDPFFSFCRPVFAPFSRHVARNNIIERRAKTPGQIPFWKKIYSTGRPDTIRRK